MGTSKMKDRAFLLLRARIVEIWKANMNTGIWVANKKARALMDQGVTPPETGSVARNPFAWYNLCLALLYGNDDFYRLKLQSPRLIEPLPDPVHQPNL